MYFIYFKCVIVLCSIYLSNALYEDQVGKFDWKQSYVGRVKYSFIDNVGKRVFVATENNVVASINLVDGSLLWRKVLESGSAGAVHAFSVGNEVVTVSGRGPYLLRGWNLKSGLLHYEWLIQANSNAKNYQWTADSSKIYRVRFLEGHIELFTYLIKTGNSTGSNPRISTPWMSSTSKCLLDKGYVICVSSDWRAHILSLADSTLVSSNIPLPSDSFATASLNRVASPYPSAVLESSQKDEKDGVEVVFTFFEGRLMSQPLTQCVSRAIRRTDSIPVIICATHCGEVYEIQAYSLERKARLAGPVEVHHNSKLTKGTITSLVDLSPHTLDTNFLIVGDDDSLILAEKDKVLWVREEALANVVTAEMIDLPVTDEEAEIEKEFANKEGGIYGMFLRRIQSQALQIVNFPMSILGLKKSSEDSVNSLRRDQFGLHKLIILITKSSKIFGLESDKGRIIWQVYMEDLAPFSVLGKLSVPFFVQRTSRHFSLPSLVSLIFKQKRSGLSALYSFNPITGQPLYGGLRNLDYKVKQVVQLPQEDNEFIKGLVLVSDKDVVHVFPPSSQQIALDFHQSLYMFTVNTQEGLLEGYSFVQPTPNNLGVVKIWNVRLSPPILAIAIKNKAERVHSQGRVLADRSVLYKYINPHLIAVATYNSDPVHKSLVTVFLIDTVNGAIVFSANHKRATPPVYMVHSENWVVYSFYNEKSRRTELISLDLYEGISQRNSTEFSSINAPPMEPFVERQAYIFPYYVMAMRDTITEKGITNKHVLVGVSTGSVMEVPWVLLDPHRSPDSREEGVIPYTPDLTLPHETIITYNHTLPHIGGIHTSPSGLESTSLVLIYGLDLFYTRVAPSKTFDVLKDDFEYWLITLVLGGLISAAYITKRLASRKALRQAWK